MYDPKPYPSYKQSGIAWLGTVPETWELRRTKTLLRERSEKGHPDEPLLAATQTMGVVRKERYENRTVLALKDLHLLKFVRVGDFVISLRSFQGGIEYARDQGIISPAYTILHTDNQNVHDYLGWLFKSRPYIDNLRLYVTGIRQGQNLDYEKLSRSLLPLPSADECAAIARFLDYADRRIRRYVLSRQKLIGLLGEQRQALVHEALTRGLDPSVSMKPSGIGWVGDIPEHWKVARLSQFFTLQRGFDITKAQQRVGDIPVVSSGGISSYHDRATANGPGVIVGRKGTAGSVHFVASDYWAHDTTLWVNDFKGNWPRFIYYLLGALDLKRFDTGSANPTLNRNVIHPEIVAFPPIDEQIRIASVIDRDLAEIERYIASTNREIALLREYRTRLIADVVTGKLDVREAAAGLSDEVEPPDVTPLDTALDDDDDSDLSSDDLSEEEEVIA